MGKRDAEEKPGKGKDGGGAQEVTKAQVRGRRQILDDRLMADGKGVNCRLSKFMIIIWSEFV
jgi:hypothetical protein